MTDEQAHIDVVIPAGGSGERFWHSWPEDGPILDHHDKLLLPYEDGCVLTTTVSAVLSWPRTRRVVIAARKSQINVYRRVLNEHRLGNSVDSLDLVEGGDTRRESVYRGLCALENPSNLVVIHDAARPVVNAALFERCYEGFQQSPHWVGSVVGLPVMDTLKRVSPKQSVDSAVVISETVSREQFWRVQTPQLFVFDVLKNAHDRVAKEVVVTDDSQLIERAKLGEVGIVLGDAQNEKITVPADYEKVQVLLKA